MNVVPPIEGISLDHTGGRDGPQPIRRARVPGDLPGNVRNGGRKTDVRRTVQDFQKEKESKVRTDTGSTLTLITTFVVTHYRGMITSTSLNMNGLSLSLRGLPLAVVTFFRTTFSVLMFEYFSL